MEFKEPRQSTCPLLFRKQKPTAKAIFCARPAASGHKKTAAAMPRLF
jgi:hypothetical protein